MLEFMKTKQPFGLGEHSYYKPEQILFPDETKKHIASMNMTFMREMDFVSIDTTQIDIKSGEREEFQVRMKIAGIYAYASKNN